ncbi:MAG: outer membrane lipoprotein chaperone LolA [Gammaproteobacteria bacterium]|jgi:outer membrane lipoprotein carrier protein
MKNNSLIYKVILWTCFLIFPFLARAENAAAELESMLSSSKSMSADFVQTTTGAKNVTASKTFGKMALKRPGKFRWEVIKPNKQLILADGKNLWVYDVDLEQVTKKKIDYAETSSPAMLLSGSREALEKVFLVEKLAASNSSETVFKLTPKSQNAMYGAVFLYFNSGKLARMKILDNLGQSSTLQFENAKINTALPSSLFEFHLPQGVDLIEN